MSAPAPPLDERQWQRPEIPQWYQANGPAQGFPWASTYMHENMLHRYLAESDFFDFTSKNGLPIDQSTTDPGAWALTHNRRDFEQWLSQNEGVEYVIVDGANLDLSTTPPKNGLWVIRKQDRKKIGGRNELTTLGTYFLIRENMYQAPSVADVVGNRLLSATAALSDFFEQAAVQPEWSPTQGYTYVTSSSKDLGITAGQSPSGSREGSVAPGLDTQSVREGSVQPGAQTTSTSEDAIDSRKTLLALRNTLQYKDEYLDENPIVGEPGHFSFTSSIAAVKKRKADEDAAAKAKELAAAQAATPAIMKTEKAPSPPAVMTEAKAKDRRSSKMGDKIKRKKSRHNLQSPSTPLSATSSNVPNSAI